MITLPNCRVSILRFCFLWVSFYNFSVSHCRILFLSLIAYRIISAWLFKYFKLMLTARNNRLHVYNLWRHLVFGLSEVYLLSYYRIIETIICRLPCELSSRAMKLLDSLAISLNPFGFSTFSLSSANDAPWTKSSTHTQLKYKF